MLAFTASSAQTAADLAAGVYFLCATEDCFVTMSANPATAAADGTSMFIPSKTIVSISNPTAQRLAAIREDTNGNLYIMPLKATN